MKTEEGDMERKKWIAAAMGMTLPGMGQVYIGELLKGSSYFVIFLVLIIAGFRWSVYLSDRFLALGVMATVAVSLGIYAISIVDAYRTAGRLRDYHSKVYNLGFFYLAAWLLGSLLITGQVYNYVRTTTIEAYKIPSRSMEPTVMRGDRVIADKTAYSRMAPKKGDIVVFVYLDDRSKIFMKRIEGLPGDTVPSQNGMQQVPHGMVYVLGDNREQSTDSRSFGFVPLRDVLGKVRQIYYSRGDEGIRWNRIGKALE